MNYAELVKAIYEMNEVVINSVTYDISSTIIGVIGRVDEYEKYIEIVLENDISIRFDKNHILIYKCYADGSVDIKFLYGNSVHIEQI